MVRLVISATALSVAAFLLSWSSPAYGADPDPAAVAKAEKFLKAEERVILLAAHPTVTFGKSTVSEWKKDEKNYKITVTYEFKDRLGGTYTTDLCFKCNDSGRVLECEAGNSTTPLGAFFATDNLIALGKAKLSTEIQKMRLDPAKAAELKAALTQLEKLVKEKDGKGLLVMYLKFRQSSDRP